MIRKVLLLTLLMVLIAVTTVAAEKGSISPTPGGSWKSVALQNGPGKSYLVDEGFEVSVPPNGWSGMSFGNASTWEQSAVANSGAFSAVLLYGEQGTMQDEWLVTAAINTTGLTSLMLRWAEAADYWDDYGDTHTILISTTVPDDPAAFTAVHTMTPGDHAIDSWQTVQVDLGAYVGLETVYVAFRYEGSWADNWAVDDVLVFQPLDHDVKADGVSPTNVSIFARSTLAPTARVVNMGGGIETCGLRLTVTRDGILVANNTVTVTDLAPNEMREVVFPRLTTTVGEWVLTSTVILAGDEWPDNDVSIGVFTCADQERTPFGILYSNWGCGYCPAANSPLNDWFDLQGNGASLIRVHMWYPSGSDPMYLANPDEAQFLAGMTPATITGTPTLYMDNLHDAWDDFGASWAATIEDHYLASAATPSPLTLGFGYTEPAAREDLEVVVDITQNLGAGDHVLYLAVTEDDIAADGGNGETVHHQVFRKLFPGTAGTPIVNTVGAYAYPMPITLDPSWDVTKLRVTVWVQEVPGGAVLNSMTRMLSEALSPVEDQPDTPAAATRLLGNAPNPFNPLTTISFTVDRDQTVTVSVFTMDGQRVAVLADGLYTAGEHRLQWNGKDFTGRDVASGTYLVHLATGDGDQAHKMSLVR